MPIFKYTAIDSDGNKIKSTLSSSDKEAAGRFLTNNGYIVQSISEARGETTGVENFAVRFGRVGMKEKILFFRMFSSLIKSNVTVSESINILIMQTEGRRLRNALGNIRGEIESGVPLSDAMAAYPRIFPDLVTSMIRAGELGGILDVVLDRISDYLESKAALRSKMIMSMIYPSIVLVVSIVVIIFLVAFVIPKFAKLLQGRKLPANTQLLLDVADFMQIHALEITGAFAGLGALGVILMSIEPARLVIDRFKIYIPVLGPVMRYGVIVQFAKTFASLLESGITLIDALRAVGDTIGNLEARRLISMMNQKVLAGEELSSALKAQTFFTPMFVAMIKIGEETGLMDQSMASVGELHEKILTDKIATLTAMVEPALLIVLGGLVGYVAWGLIAGMMAMYSG